MSQMVGVGTQVTRGGPGATGPHVGPRAAPSREAGAGAMGTCGSLRAAPSREAGAVVLT
jgi:hypothetical protein